MSIEGHTPGPWEAVIHDDPRGQPQPMYRGLVAMVEHGDRYLAVVHRDGRTVSRDEWEPNARLIALAPQMAEELALIRSELDLPKGASAAMIMHAIGLLKRIERAWTSAR